MHSGNRRAPWWENLCTVKYGHLEQGLHSLWDFCVTEDLASFILWREIIDYLLWLSRMLWKIYCFEELNVTERKGFTPLSAKTLLQWFWMKSLPKAYTFPLLLKYKLNFTWGMPITNYVTIREILDNKFIEKWMLQKLLVKSKWGL